MVYGDLQKYDEKQRAAICEHLYDREAEPTGEAREESKDCMEQAPVEDTRREQATAVAKDRIDREEGLLRRVHILGRNSAHGYEYSLEAHRSALPRWEGITVGIDHNYSSAPTKTVEAWGTLEGPFEVDENGTWGNLRFLKKHVLTEQTLEQIETGIGNLGLSPVNRVLREQNKTVLEFFPTRVDIVAGAATVKGVFEQAPAESVAPPPDTRVEQLAQRVTQLETQLQQFATNRQAVETQVAKVSSAFDLSTFWRTK